MYWNNRLHQVFAMLQVKMPDGSTYGQEAGITVLENCFSLFASQRPTVAAICSALTEGWRKFVDLLVVSTESFVDVCRKVQASDYWIEGDVAAAQSSSNKGDKDDANTIKQLKAELASIKKSRGRFGNSPNGRNSYSSSPNSANGAAPCFNFFAGKPCAKDPCPFRHTGPPDSAAEGRPPFFSSERLVAFAAAAHALRLASARCTARHAALCRGLEGRRRRRLRARYRPPPRPAAPIFLLASSAAVESNMTAATAGFRPRRTTMKTTMRAVKRLALRVLCGLVGGLRVLLACGALGGA